MKKRRKSLVDGTTYFLSLVFCPSWANVNRIFMFALARYKAELASGKEMGVGWGEYPLPGV